MQLVRALFFRLFLFGGFTLSYPIVWIAAILVLPQRRADVWNQAALTLVRVGLRLAGVHIHVQGQKPPLESPVIVAANHLSVLDGFILTDLFDGRLFSLTAPFHNFPFPFPYWFARASCLGVRRDWHDDLFYPDAPGRGEAVRTLLGLLKMGTSVLIFPEGHYERTSELHYFHTGAARLSIAAQVPVCPIAIAGFDKVFAGSWKLVPGVVTFKIGKLIPPPRTTVNDREAVCALRDRIEDTIAAELPRRNVPPYLHAARPEKIAAFFDIDRTIYDGYSQQDFLKYLLAHHELPMEELLQMFGWILEEKVGLLPHRELMERAYGVFDGWQLDHLAKTCQTFFNERVPRHVFDNILPYIKDHQEEGHATVLVTEVVEPLALAFKTFFEMQDAVATRLVARRGRCVGSVHLLIVGEEKARAARAWAGKHRIDLTQSYAYADSPSDFALLHTVGHPTAVRPQHALLEEAKKRRWKILH